MTRAAVPAGEESAKNEEGRTLMPDVMKTVGRYEILRELGRGGMALVYLARQTDLDRFVALKELGAFHASDAVVRPALPARVARGRLAEPPEHRHRARLLRARGHAVHRDGVRRARLAAPVRRQDDAWRRSAACSRACSPGLTNAEQHGIVHRDLKPENLMVTSDGRVKIADFGIAKATTKMQTGAFLTATGTTVGTPTYMAPEQAMAQDIGPWTDLYSVGCMAFEMFTGKVPFHDSDAPMAILLRHVNEPIAPVKSINPRGRPGHLGLGRGDARQGSDAAHAVGGRRVGRLRGDHHRAARPALAARGAAGRASRSAAEGPNPLTPAPFQGTTAGAAASDEFQSFAWGQPAADTDGCRRVHAVHAAAAGPAVGPDGGDAGARGAARRRRRGPAPRPRPSRAAPRPPRPRRPHRGARTGGAERRARRRLRLRDVRPAGARAADRRAGAAARRRPAGRGAREPAAPEPPAPEPSPRSPPPSRSPSPSRSRRPRRPRRSPPPTPASRPTSRRRRRGRRARTPAPTRCRASRRRPSRPLPSRRRPSPSPPEPEPVAAAPAPPAARAADGAAARARARAGARAPPAPAPSPPVRQPRRATSTTRTRRSCRRRCAEARAEGQAQEGAQAEGGEGAEAAKPQARAEGQARREGEKPSKALPIALGVGALLALALGFMLGGSGGGGEAAPSRPPTPAR